MNQKSMTSDDKFKHYFVGTLLLLLAVPIAVLGLSGIWFAFFGNHDQPGGLFAASYFVSLVGAGASILAFVCIDHARRTPLRPY